MGACMNRLKLIYSAGVAAISSIAFTVAITIAAEQSAPLKNQLKAISGHHWTTKSIISILVYLTVMFLIYAMSMNPTPRRLNRILYSVSASALIGYVVLLVFYLTHYF
jgi:hypothetical protein